MHITLRQLQVFEAVARHLSYTRASEELHLTQPAVSMQVKQLESAVGMPLFEQLGKRIFLAPAGELLLTHSQKISAEIKEAAQRLNDLKGVEGGRVKITVASTVNYFATRLLGEFCREHPRTRVALDVTNRKDLLRQLENNEPDIVLMGRPPRDMDVEAEPFMENPLIVIASPDHGLAKQKSIPLETVVEETFIKREVGSGTRIAMERFFSDHGTVPSHTIEMSSTEAIKQSVAAGLGLGVVSAHTVELELEAKRLVQLKVQHFPIRRKWYVAHRKGKQLSAAAQVFKQFVLNHK